MYVCAMCMYVHILHHQVAEDVDRGAYVCVYTYIHTYIHTYHNRTLQEDVESGAYAYIYIYIHT